MGEQKDFQDREAHCRVHGEASGPTSDDVPCPLPHSTARCPVCWVGWIGPGPDDSVVLCILTRHIVETHPNTAQPRPSDSTRCSWVGPRIPTTGVTTIPNSTVVSCSWSPCRDRLRSRPGARTSKRRLPGLVLRRVQAPHSVAKIGFRRSPSGCASFPSCDRPIGSGVQMQPARQSAFSSDAVR